MYLDRIDLDFDSLVLASSPIAIAAVDNEPAA